jgi:hypothetical protein
MCPNCSCDSPKSAGSRESMVMSNDAKSERPAILSAYQQAEKSGAHLHESIVELTENLLMRLEPVLKPASHGADQNGPASEDSERASEITEYFRNLANQSDRSRLFFVARIRDILNRLEV